MHWLYQDIEKCCSLRYYYKLVYTVGGYYHVFDLNNKLSRFFVMGRNYVKDFSSSPISNILLRGFFLDHKQYCIYSKKISILKKY